MGEDDWLAGRFEASRPRLRAMACKISRIEVIADPARLRELDLAVLDG